LTVIQKNNKVTLFEGHIVVCPPYKKGILHIAQRLSVHLSLNLKRIVIQSSLLVRRFSVLRSVMLQNAQARHAS